MGLILDDLCVQHSRRQILIDIHQTLGSSFPSNDGGPAPPEGRQMDV